MQEEGLFWFTILAAKSGMLKAPKLASKVGTKKVDEDETSEQSPLTFLFGWSTMKPSASFINK